MRGTCAKCGKERMLQFSSSRKVCRRCALTCTRCGKVSRTHPAHEAHKLQCYQFDALEEQTELQL